MPDTTSSDLANELQKPVAAAPGHRESFFRGFFFWALSLFFLGMGMKLLMMQRCINSLPYYDQWEAEAGAIYLPYFQHILHLANFFRPQNEHRIFFTYLYDFVLLLLNKQWDSQVQMVFNAVIHSATIAAFAWLMAVLMGRRYWPFIWLPLAVAVASPFGWENALWGFQSQFYFLMLFSLLTICLMACNPLSLPWHLGFITGICAIFSMASGLLPFVAVGALLVLDMLKNPRKCPRHLRALGLCAAFAFAGLLMVGKEGADQTYAAHSLKEFFLSLGKNLSWPLSWFSDPAFWLFPLNLFPLLLFGWVYFRSQEKNHPAERIILGLGILTILQSIAIAIMRGSGGPPPAWRYMDTLCFLFTANFLSAALLLFKYRNCLRFPQICRLILFVWLIASVSGLWSLDMRAWNDVLPRWEHFQQTRVSLTRQFLATDDATVFANRDLRELPWIFVPGLAALLRSNEIRSILPACARDPLKIMPSNPVASPFLANGVLLDKPDPPTEFCLGSYRTNGVPARGMFESIPLKSSLPYLQIQVAGNLGNPGLSLELADLASGKTTEIKPAHEPGRRWINIDVKAPSGFFKLVAHDESATGWFAFKEPREMGRLSFWAQKVIGTAKYALATGCFCFVIALASYYFPSRNNLNSEHHAPNAA